MEFFIGNNIYHNFSNSHGTGFQVKSYLDRLSIFGLVPWLLKQTQMILDFLRSSEPKQLLWG